MNEAKASLNFYGVSANGWNLQFTLRSDDENNLLERFADFSNILLEKGVKPKAVGSSAQATSHVPGAPKVYLPNNPDKPLQSIPIEKIIFGGTGKDGNHPFWRVFGGWAQQYGITAFPEVIKKAGLKLDPLHENIIDAGYVAWYSSKPKKDSPEEMTADKVVRIEALGATPDDVFGGGEETEMNF